MTEIFEEDCLKIGCEKKDLLFFKESTDSCRYEGYISKKANSSMGSLIITKLNDKEARQIVHGMPKLHEWDSNNFINNTSSLKITEKIDGINIAVFPLYDNGGRIREVCFKSRGNPGLTRDLADYLEELNSNGTISFEMIMKEVIRQQKTMFFELYGNKINHFLGFEDRIKYDINLGIKYIGSRLPNGSLLSITENNVTSRKIRIAMPIELFKISRCSMGNYLVEATDEFIEKYKFKYYSFNETIKGCYDFIADRLELINSDSVDRGSGNQINGVMFFGTKNLEGLKDEYLWIKCNPKLSIV